MALAAGAALAPAQVLVYDADQCNRPLHRRDCGRAICLRPLAAFGLAFWPTAGALAFADSRIRIEPAATDPPGALPGSGHAPSSDGAPGGQFLASRGGLILESAKASCPIVPQKPCKVL